MNGDQIIARVHRAHTSEDRRVPLRFTYADFGKVSSYTRKEACGIFGILAKIGVEELYPILRDTFQVISQDSVDENSRNRRSDDTLSDDQISKRVRSSTIEDDSN
ncbi:hypothetical protein MMC14_010212 [Varicellaria rhodocarpa]|nr:hypothetical protein [Varicellaria rhodocarpa]